MWSNHSVFYQIYPLGAFGCPFENDFKVEPRILDVLNWKEHLNQLGVDAILLNPLFESHSHGYDTIDYFKLDSRLGTNQDLVKVMDVLHAEHKKIIFDAVFNHVGRGFTAFQDVLKNRENSKYKDWFYINFYDNNCYQDNLSYQCWEGNTNLVKLNLNNVDVVAYLFDVVDFWIDTFHIDGLRLDVAYCLDKEFLCKLRQHCKSKNDDFFLMGETLHGDYNQWMNPNMLDSCTNYECYKGLYSSFNAMNLFEISHSLQRQFGKEPWCLYRGKYLFNFVDNHDVTRVASILSNPSHLHLIYVLLFCMPGIPCVYYGSEWGMQGHKNWNDTELRPHIHKLEWNTLTSLIKKLINIKHKYSALCDGDYFQVVLMNTYCVFERSNNHEKIWIAMNIGDQPIEIPVSYNGNSYDLVNETGLEINGNLWLNAYDFKIIKF